MRLEKIFFYVAILMAMPGFLLAEVAPFGLTIGKANISNVKKVIGQKTSIKNIGINKWTSGKMLESDGSGLGLNALQKVTYIFNKDDILVGMMLDLPKGRYDDILSSLKQKYTLTNELKPFVGDKTADFKDEEVNIKVLAPHLGFNMALNYFHNDLMEKYNTLSQIEKAAKKKKETGLL